MIKTQESLNTSSPKLFDSALSSPIKSIKTTPGNNFDCCPFKSLAHSTVKMSNDEVPVAEQNKQNDYISLGGNVASSETPFESGYQLLFDASSILDWIGNFIKGLRIRTVPAINRINFDLAWAIDQAVPRDSKYRNLALL